MRRAIGGTSRPPDSQPIGAGTHGSEQRIRGLLGELGIVSNRHGRAASSELLNLVVAGEHDQLPAPMGMLLTDLKEELQALDQRIARLNQLILNNVRRDVRIQCLLAVEGVAPIRATALVAVVGESCLTIHVRETAGTTPQSRPSSAH